jgi:hypothetical protein
MFTESVKFSKEDAAEAVGTELYVGENKMYSALNECDGGISCMYKFPIMTCILGYTTLIVVLKMLE